MTTFRRSFLKNAAAALATVLPGFGFGFGYGLAQAAASVRSNFVTQSGAWRTVEVITRTDLAMLDGMTRVTLPVPSVNSHHQESLQSSFSSNGSDKIT